MRKHITSKQFEDAFASYYVYSKQFEAGLNRRQTLVDFKLDRIVCLNVAVATYDDIDRYKDYHLRNKNRSQGQRSDVVKRAAYFAKWTSKLRPIMLVRSSDIESHESTDLGLMANESLAISLALDFISLEVGTRVKLSKKTRTELLYDLHYREIGDDALLAMFQMILDLARSGEGSTVLEFAS